MKIDLDSLFNHDSDGASTKTCTVTLDMTELVYNTGNYHISNIEPISFEVTKNGKDDFSITGNVSMTLRMQCDRCLIETYAPMNFPVEYDINLVEEAEESYINGRTILVQELLYPDMLMNVPAKVLCRQDCKGLCHVCGHNLNESDCGCDRFVPDPRMAVISDIFKKFDNK